MIDLHCHILPALDDGPKVVEQSLAIARAALERGIHAVAATPHVLESQVPVLNRAAIEAAMEKFRERLQAEKLPLLLHLGAEYYLSAPFPRLAETHWPLASLGGSRYVLIEIAMTQIPPYLEYSSLHSGVKNEEIARQIPYLFPVLAHPERYAEIVGDWRKAQRIRSQGYLLQVNLGSLAGRYGRSVRKTAEKLIKEKLVALVASDAHTHDAMIEVVEGGLKRLRKVAGEETTRILTEENPRRILQGQELLNLEDYA